METVQIVLDKKLLLAADRAAQRANQNLSDLMRAALRQHLRTLAVQEMDRRDREGHLRQPQGADDFEWDAVAAWPED